MDQEQHKVLQLLADGVITAAEADRLLQVLESAVATDVEAIRPAPFEFPPRPGWSEYQSALLVLGGTSVIIGLGAVFVVLGGTISGWWLLLILPAMLVGITLLLLGWWSGHNRWLHLHVETEDVNFRISLPLPLSWLVWIFKVTRFFEPRLAVVTDEALDALVETEGLFHVAVDEDDAYVQVYYG